MLHSEKISQAKLRFILNNLRDVDKLEMISEFGNKWKDIIVSSLDDSSNTLSIIADEQNLPVGIFGVKPIDNSAAEICLLSTNKLKYNSTSFLLQSKKIIKNWSNTYGTLYNRIYKHNKNAIRWLKWLGFSFTEFDDKRLFFYLKGDFNE